MKDDNTHNIILDHLRGLREGQQGLREDLGGDISSLKDDVNRLRNEVREGFAASNAHDYAQHADMKDVRDRLSMLEDEVGRLKIAQGLESDTDH